MAMAANPPEELSLSRFRFTLSEILVGVAAVAIGLAIWRLPQGNWIDIPVATLSFYFMVSLVRGMAATRRMSSKSVDLPSEQRWGAKILLAIQAGLALTLGFAWIFRYLAANEVLLVPPESIDYMYVHLPTLPRDLTLLTMLAATGIGSWQSASSTKAKPRQNVYAVVAAGLVLIGLIAYWGDRMLIPFLVYIAVSGIEMCQPAKLLPPEMNISTTVRIHRFMTASFAGMALLILNLLLLFGLVQFCAQGAVSLGVTVAPDCGFNCRVWHYVLVSGTRDLAIVTRVSGCNLCSPFIRHRCGRIHGHHRDCDIVVAVACQACGIQSLQQHPIPQIDVS